MAPRPHARRGTKDARRDSLACMARAARVVHLSSRGQIVIPAHVRRTLGLKTGQALSVATGNGREIVFRPVEDGLQDLDDMLRRIRSWAAKSGRDLVAELHQRRRREREEEIAKRGSRGH